MAKFYTAAGDDGYSGLLGDARVPKYHPRLETIGTIDETSAALGAARAFCLTEQAKTVLLDVQRDLYNIMAEVSATPENALRFRMIGFTRVEWLEQQTDTVADQVTIPQEFIVPGDCQAGAMLALARTISRRAERRIAELYHTGEFENQDILRYLNRLSSLCFALELLENQASGAGAPTFAKNAIKP